MAAKPKYKKPAPPSNRTIAKKVLLGVGLGAIVGGGIPGAFAGYLIGGAPVAVGGALGAGVGGAIGAASTAGRKVFS